jgi:hypothetical protein
MVKRIRLSLLQSPTHLEVDGLVVELETDLATAHLHPLASLLLDLNDLYTSPKMVFTSLGD